MTNHLWQSTVFAAVVGLVTLALRKNRAQIRYWLWMSASLKFLVPFALLIGFGAQLHWASAAKKIAKQPVSSAVVGISEPFPEDLQFTPVAQRTNWFPIAVAIWACGFAGVALSRMRSWLRVRNLVRASIPIEVRSAVEVRSAPGLLEPGVVGIFRPVLLLPEDIMARLAPEQLEAVLAHELSHIRRRDNLTSALHMVVEAVFWFHPMVWWIGARLVEERERACDEEVLRLGNAPQVYAEAILDVCKYYLEARLACVAGVGGADLKKRVRAILAGTVAGNLSFAKKVALACAGMVAIALPVFVGGLRAQTAAPKFEVASIRVCEGGSAGKTGGEGRGGEMNKKTGMNGATTSPDRLSLNCMPLTPLIRTAYVTFAGGHFNNPIQSYNPEIEGVPKWAQSERYTINATSEATPGQEMMRGPMLAALLEERFQLKVRREARDVPVYDMTVAKGGLKLKPVPEGGCVPMVITFPPTPPPAPGEKPLCGGGRFEVHGPNVVVDMKVTTLDDLARILGGVFSDRPVMNKTEGKGLFEVKLEFVAPEGARGRGGRGEGRPAPEASDVPPGPSMFTALQEVGLKLEAARGPKDFLVVEKVERPSAN